MHRANGSVTKTFFASCSGKILQRKICFRPRASNIAKASATVVPTFRRPRRDASRIKNATWNVTVNVNVKKCISIAARSAACLFALQRPPNGLQFWYSCKSEHRTCVYSSLTCRYLHCFLKVGWHNRCSIHMLKLDSCVPQCVQMIHYVTSHWPLKVRLRRFPSENCDYSVL